MTIADLAKIEGRRYPARRHTQSMVGDNHPIKATNFAMGHVTLDPNGGQVPWHNQEQEEIYFVIEGTGEICLGEERQELKTGQMVYIPPTIFHQLTNTGSTPLRMIYVYARAVTSRIGDKNSPALYPKPESTHLRSPLGRNHNARISPLNNTASFYQSKL